MRSGTNVYRVNRHDARTSTMSNILYHKEAVEMRTCARMLVRPSIEQPASTLCNPNRLGPKSSKRAHPPSLVPTPLLAAQRWPTLLRRNGMGTHRSPAPFMGPWSVRCLPKWRRHPLPQTVVLARTRTSITPQRNRSIHRNNARLVWKHNVRKMRCAGSRSDKR